MIASLLSSAAMSPWKRLALGLAVALLVILAAAAGAWRGYSWGFERADARRGAEIADLRAAHAKEREIQAQALAEAETALRQRLEDQARLADALASSIAAARRKIADQARTITSRRIEHATAGVDCVFGPDFIRVCNEAAGAAPAAGSPMPGSAPGSSGIDAQARPSADPAAGLPRGDTVTPADVLAWLRDYGAWCQGAVAQLHGLIAWEAGNGGHR